MGNFWKAIRESSQYLPLILAATFCSVGIAFLWGSNISALAPVIDITLHNDSIQGWLRKKSDAQQVQIDTLISEQANLQAQKATDSDVQQLKDQLADAASSLEWTQWEMKWAQAIFPEDPFQTICFIMAVLVFSTLVKHLLMLTSDMLLGYASTAIVRNLRQRVFDKALHMDKPSFQAYGTSGLLAAITSAAEGLSSGLMATFGAAIREPLRVISCLLMACFISWRLLLLSIVLAPLLVAIVIYFNRKIRSIASSILGRNAGFHEILLEALNNVFTVQAFTMEKQEKERFADCTSDMRKISMKMIFYTGLSKPFTELVGIGMVAITVCAGSYLVLNRETHLFFFKIRDTPITITELLIFFGLLVGASDPLRKLSGVSVTIYSGAMAANMLYGILGSNSSVAEPSHPEKLTGAENEICLSNVSFQYHPNHPVLKNVDISIPWGKTVAILGRNGCGKSTLIQLICRYYDPSSGEISLGGIDIKNLSLDDLRKRIAIVSQTTELFNRSVMDNIRYGSPGSTEDDAIQAAKLAHAHDFIKESLSDGYNTIVGQSGQRLSGGQRQRIALARAILRRPEILILDESTSQIDMASELQIRETLQAMKGKFTIIIITHREALVALADETYEMQDGQLKSITYDWQNAA
jgi:ATP-binding cassette, subfamily B, bacterial MsbA